MSASDHMPSTCGLDPRGGDAHADKDHTLPGIIRGETTDENGFLAHRILDDGRTLALVPMTFGNTRLTVGHGMLTYDDGY